MASTLYSPSKLSKWVFTTTTTGRVKCTRYERDDQHQDEWGWVGSTFISRGNADMLYKARIFEGWTTC